jgi:hypothetical protein
MKKLMLVALLGLSCSGVNSPVTTTEDTPKICRYFKYEGRLRYTEDMCGYVICEGRRVQVWILERPVDFPEGTYMHVEGDVEPGRMTCSGLDDLVFCHEKDVWVMPDPVCK